MNADDAVEGIEKIRRGNDLTRLLSELHAYVKKVPVVGFNSQKYDINVMKAELFRRLKALDVDDGEIVTDDDDDDVDTKSKGFIVKKNNTFPCVETARLRFLDICNFIAPGYSYDKYLKAYKCEQQKGFFPYEWMDGLNKLKDERLPPRDAFYSRLKKKGISERDYAYCQAEWARHGMKTVEDFLIWYNNGDVEPFVKAIERQRTVYKDKGIDMLKEAISLPGLAVRWMFKEAPQPTLPRDDGDFSVGRLLTAFRASAPVCLVDERNSDMYSLIKDNLVGGPSIVFHRYHEKGQTSIRRRQFGDEARPCQSVKGVDANALYLWCMMQDMPTGHPKRTRADGSADTMYGCSKAALGWLSYKAWKGGVDIRHAMNGGEARLGNRNLPVDGFDCKDSAVYEFHGCYWHGHGCPSVPADKCPRPDALKRTAEKERYLRRLGYKVVTIWECEWTDFVNANPDVKAFLAAFHHAHFPKTRPIVLKEVVDRITSGKFFGLVECDISVPDELREKFSEMTPVFKNVEVTRQQLGPRMTAFADGKHFLKRPSRMLIGSMFGEKVLLLSALARWYLSHGLIITKVYQLIEYSPRAAFRSFGESVSAARRSGDKDPDQELLATTSKLIGNSSYGKTITDKTRHRDVSFVAGDREASIAVRSNTFASMDEIDDQFYEVVKFKRKVSTDADDVAGHGDAVGAPPFFDHTFLAVANQCIEQSRDSNSADVRVGDVDDVVDASV